MISIADLLTLGVAAVGIVLGPLSNRRKDRKAEQAGTVEPPCPRCEVCPLSSLGAGEAGCLLRVGAGRRLRRRLAELGLTPGVQMTVLQNTGGPVLICVRSSRLALGREMAHKLDVRPVPPEEILP